MTEIGLGAREALSVPGVGSVLWRGPEAAWLRLPGGILGLAGRSAPSGPLWARGEFGLEGVEPGAAIGVDEVVALVGQASVWEGTLPAPAALLAGAALALDTLASVPAPEDLPEVRSGDPGAAAAVLAGLGPGLTPAGDDVLCGLLLARRALGGPATERALLAVVDGLPTTDLSLAFLRWSARGQQVAPLHDLLGAAASGDPAAARDAAGRLAAFGATSGRAMAHGVRLALASYRAARRARPTPPAVVQPATTTSTSETARSVFET